MIEGEIGVEVLWYCWRGNGCVGTLWNSVSNN